MKFIFKIILFMLIIVSIIISQNIEIEKVNDKNIGQSYKIDARPFLMKQEKEVTKFLSENPNYFNELKLKKQSAWNFSVGSTKSWYAYNLDTEAFYTVPSTCKAVGENCYIFVENSIWNSEVTADNVNAIKMAFDNSTPANSNKGIYQTVVESFGTPPDVDGDPKIIILILDIKDGYDGSGGYVAGYFHSVNEISHSKSNMAEIYYLDANPSDLSTETGLDNVMSTTAHEFQHMIHFNYHDGSSGNPLQITFLNEGCSLAAEVVCGYQIYNQSLFNNEYNHYLLDWRSGDDVLNDYSRAARYVTYLYEQFGNDFLRRLVQSNLTGISSVNDALSNLSSPTTLRFEQTLENWFVANILNDKTINSTWGYETKNVYKVNSLNLSNPNYESQNIKVKQAASDYITFSSGKNLSIKFDDFGNAKLKFKAIKHKINNEIVVQDIAANTLYSFSDFGSEFQIITFVIMNKSSGNTYSYSFNSTGETNTVILAYDENLPTGVLGLSNNDTVCVFFDGVSGGSLDSIKVALRQAGSVYGVIYEYTGASRPTPLGKVLVPNLTVTSTITQTPKYNFDTETYPNPWPNWINIDLTSYNLDAEKPFVAAFLVEGTYPDNNRIMVTKQENINNHSYSFLNNPSSGSPDWFYLSSGESTVFAYLIRAYVSFNITDVTEQVMEILPNNFVLEQNFPNPFNPTTTIKYSIPVVGTQHAVFLQLTIYDILGSKVTTLVNKQQTPGNYEINFDASNLTSGIYYYTLSAGGFFETKKMILLK